MITVREVQWLFFLFLSISHFAGVLSMSVAEIWAYRQKIYVFIFFFFAIEKR